MWKVWNCVRRTAPNFGGLETWWEAEIIHTDGRIVFATGPTAQEARAAGWRKVELLENPEHQARLEALMNTPSVDTDGNPLSF